MFCVHMYASTVFKMDSSLKNSVMNSYINEDSVTNNLNVVTGLALTYVHRIHTTLSIICLPK